MSDIKHDRAALYAAATRIIQAVQQYPKAQACDRRNDWLAAPLSRFRRLEPVGFGLRYKVRDWCSVDLREIPPNLVWPLDVGLITDPEFVADRADATYSVYEGEDDSEVVDDPEDNVIQLARYYTIAAKQARGYAVRFSPFMLRIDYAFPHQDEMVFGGKLRAWLGGHWSDAKARDSSMSFRSRYLEIPSVSIMALEQRYEWAVALGFDGSPSVRFATDPTGMKEVFKVRDLPEGRDRRAALLTWVNDHWRQQRHDPDVEVYVRKHLRGTTAFGWRGLQAELLPAQFDVEQRDKLIAEREAMRIAGVDRRPATGAQ